MYLKLVIFTPANQWNWLSKFDIIINQFEECFHTLFANAIVHNTLIKKVEYFKIKWSDDPH